HVSSSYWSENCGRSIALALLADGRALMGETLYVPMPDKVIEVEVTSPVFFDETGERVHGWNRNPHPSAAGPGLLDRRHRHQSRPRRHAPLAARAGCLARRLVQGAGREAAGKAEDIRIQGRPPCALARS